MHLLAAFGLLTTALAEDKSWSFSEANYTPCEGVGIHGSYRVKAFARVKATDTGKQMPYFQVSISTAVQDVTMAGSLTVTTSDGTERRILLQTPWYPVIESQTAGPTLVLPRVKTDANGPSPLEMRVLDIPKDAKLTLEVMPAKGSCALGSASETLSL